MGVTQTSQVVWAWGGNLYQMHNLSDYYITLASPA